MSLGVLRTRKRSLVVLRLSLGVLRTCERSLVVLRLSLCVLRTCERSLVETDEEGEHKVEAIVLVFSVHFPKTEKNYKRRRIGGAGRSRRGLLKNPPAESKNYASGTLGRNRPA